MLFYCATVQLHGNECSSTAWWVYTLLFKQTLTIHHCVTAWLVQIIIIWISKVSSSHSAPESLPVVMPFSALALLWWEYSFCLSWSSFHSIIKDFIYPPAPTANISWIPCLAFISFLDCLDQFCVRTYERLFLNCTLLSDLSALKRSEGTLDKSDVDKK